MTVTYDLVALGLEQGSIGSSGDYEDSGKVRSIGYVEVNPDKFNSPTLTATSSNGSIMVDFIGYDASYNLLCDLYWFDSPKTFDVSSYSEIKYFRVVLKYSDDAVISPSNITSCTLTYEEAEPVWRLDTVTGRLTNNDLPESISGGPITGTSIPPMYGYPATFWHYDSEAGKLILNNVCYTYFNVPPIVDEEIGRNDYEMLTPPYPASFWFLGTDNRLTLSLLPAPINSPMLVQPYPASFWWYDTEEGRLREVLIPDELPMPLEGGAFLDAEKLEYVKIPKSVTYIDWQAFQGTKLKKVCLSKNCSFSRTAFPDDCQIVFYEDMYDEDYNIFVAGANSYRTTEIKVHDEDSETCEIP